MRAAVVSLGAAMAVGLLACGAPDEATPASTDDVVRVVAQSVSSTIALEPGEKTLILTSPDDDQVVRLDAETLEELERFEVPGAPEALAALPDGRWLVTLSQRAEVALLDLSDGATEMIALPCGGARAAAVLETEMNGVAVLMACPEDGVIVVVDPYGDSVSRALGGFGAPTGVAVVGGRVVVSDRGAGALVTFPLVALFSTTPDVEREVRPLLAEGVRRRATLLGGLSVEPETGALLGVYQRVDNDSDRDRPAERGGYGSVFDGEPRLEPMVLASCGERYARFDGGSRVFSGPSAVAGRAGRLWVVNRFTRNVALLGCEPASDALPEPADVPRSLEHLATYRTGPGGRGVAVRADGTRAYVDVGFDHAVAILDVPSADDVGRVLEATDVKRRPVEPLRYSEMGLRGRNLFFDATNTHLTPSGVVACASCHPRGGDDGITWFIHTRGVARKLRRTAPAWNARTEAAPFHWDGEFDSGAALAQDTIVELMGGDGLLVDTAAIGVYMNEVPVPPPRPVLDDADRIVSAMGAALFNSADVGCSGCHTGPHLEDGALHDVLEPSADADGGLDAVVTRPLRGVRARAPYLHDGRAETLRDVFVTHNPNDRHGRTSQLDEAEVDALERYLQSL